MKIAGDNIKCEWICCQCIILYRIVEICTDPVWSVARAGEIVRQNGSESSNVPYGPGRSNKKNSGPTSSLEKFL